MTCSFNGCVNKLLAKGLCGSHYSQQRLGNELTPVRVVEYKTFEHMLVKSKKDGDCILWTGLKDKRGYGRLCFRGKTSSLAHRAAYILANDVDIDGMTIHHKCAKRDCINPEHLELATRADNALEMLARKDYEAEIARLQLRVIELEAELERVTYG